MREAHPAVVAVTVDGWRACAKREPAVVDLLVPTTELGGGRRRRRRLSRCRARSFLDVRTLTLLVEGEQRRREVRTVSGTRTLWPMIGCFCGVQQGASPVGESGFPADQP